MTVLLPTSLVMRQAACFYCGADYENDEVTLGDTIGIRYCATHKEDAQRDSRAYLHSERKVRLQDLLSHDVVGPFFRSLEAEEQIVRRTNGVLQGGWTLSLGGEGTVLYAKGDWCIPMIHRAHHILKGVALSQFAETGNDPTMSSLVPVVQECLTNGIYRTEETPRSRAVKPDETPGVALCVYNGRVGRILVGGDI